jgi:hypothetical protein
MGEDETGDAQVNMNVTARSDDEVELARQRATAAGLTGVVLVDDHQPPPPGTVTSASLGPLQNATMAEARAARILGSR